MAEQNEGVPAAVAGAPAAPQHASSIRLSPFWANSPAAWFNTAEAHFTLRGVTDPVEKYLIVLTALGEAQADRVRNIVEAEATPASYNALRGALVASHQLTPFQQVDKVVNAPPLGVMKPTELLSVMSKHKPDEDHHFFAYHFLQRLPREVRVLLAREDCKNMQAVAEKADGLMALHLPQHHEVAAVAGGSPDAASIEDEEAVAAVAKGGKKPGKKNKLSKKAAREKQRKDFDALQSPLCYFHVRYGDKAHRCEEPCAWPAEN
jgi:hypothetical protein